MHKRLEGSLTLKMAEFEERLKAASTPTNLTLIQLRDEFYNFKEIVSSMLSLMQRQILDCVKNIDAIDMHKRRKALLFNGMPEESQEDLSQKVLFILHEKMELSDFTVANEPYPGGNWAELARGDQTPPAGHGELSTARELLDFALGPSALDHSSETRLTESGCLLRLVFGAAERGTVKRAKA
ncbi:unnamed protein product, partial [Iphiclides podalirius]